MNQKSTLLLSFAALLIGSATVIILQQRKLDHLRVLIQQLERQQAQPENNVAAQSKSKPPSDPDYPEEANSTSSTTDLRALMTQGDSSSRLCSLTDYVEGLAPHQIADAFFELKNSPHWWPEVQFLRQLLLSRWAQEDPNAALASLERLSTRERGGAATTILSSIASVDPQMAVQWLADPDNLLFANHLTLRDTLATSVAKEWARKDSEAAVQWAQSLPDGQRLGAMNGIIDTLVSTDPEAAANLVMTVEKPSERRSFVDKVAKTWAQRDPLLAIEWAQGLKANERTRAAREALEGWAYSSPKEAAAFIDGLPQAQRTEDQVSQVAREWSLRDPASAAEWLSNQPEGESTGALHVVMFHWTKKDPKAAHAWSKENQYQSPWTEN